MVARSLLENRIATNPMRSTSSWKQGFSYFRVFDDTRDPKIPVIEESQVRPTRLPKRSVTDRLDTANRTLEQRDGGNAMPCHRHVIILHHFSSFCLSLMKNS